MITKDDITCALHDLFSASIPRRPLPLSKVKAVVALYLNLQPANISDGIMIEALRGYPFVSPYVRTRGEANIDWTFTLPVPTDNNRGIKKRKTRQYKDKPVADSLHLKKH
jgi:hypothetical protein